VDRKLGVSLILGVFSCILRLFNTNGFIGGGVERGNPNECAYEKDAGENICILHCMNE